MQWHNAHMLRTLGLWADSLTFVGGLILARDAFLRLSSLRRDRVNAEFQRQFPRLNLTDEELKEAKRAQIWTLVGTISLSAGFLLQLLLRFAEKPG